MFEIFGIPSQALFGQLLIGLINGSFYALLSLGLAVIFGMLNIINFSHGAQYMMGAFAAYLILQYSGLGYWPALIIAPILVGATGIIVERLFLQWLYKLDHLYGLMLTFGLALIFEGVARNYFGSAGLPYTVPESLQAAGILVYVPAKLSRLGHWCHFGLHAPGSSSSDGVPPRRIRPGARSASKAAHDHAYLRLRRCPCGLRRCDGGASNVAADGLRADHRCFRGGGDGAARSWGHCYRLRLGVTDQSVLPRSVETVVFVIMAIVWLVRLAACWTERVMERVLDPLAKKPSALRARPDNRLCRFARLVVAPFVTYLLFVMQAMCFALFAFNLLTAASACRLVMRFISLAKLSAYSAKVQPAGTGDPDWHCDGAVWVPSPVRSRSAGRAFICHDHAGAGADDVFLRGKAKFTGGGRHPGCAAWSSFGYRSQE